MGMLQPLHGIAFPTCAIRAARKMTRPRHEQGTPPPLQDISPGHLGEVGVPRIPQHPGIRSVASQVPIGGVTQQHPDALARRA